MRQFDFLATWDDSWEILGDVLSCAGTSVSPSRWYDKPVADTFTTLSPALKALLREKRQLYIWRPSFTEHPPALTMQELGPRTGSYFIDPSKGGPGLELVLPACFTRDDNLYLNYGSLSYPATILDRSTGESRRAPLALAEGFRDVLRTIQSHLVQDGEKWLGKEALQLLRAGTAQVYKQVPRTPSNGTVH